MLLAIFLVLISAYSFGSRAARKSYETNNLKKRLQAKDDKDEIHKEIHTMDDDIILSEFNRLHKARR